MINALGYACSNESLDSITEGLDIQPSDVVIAVAGSGDQPLAILEKAEKVIAIDMNPAQIDLVKRRIELLKRRDYSGFLDAEERGEADGWVSGHYMEPLVQANRKARERYFTENRRIEAVARKLGRLEVLEPISFLEAVQKNQFSKAYLSNILGCGNSLSLDDKLLSVLSEKLPINGLVYVSNHDDLVRHMARGIINDKKKEPLLGIFDTPEPDFLPSNMVMDQDLTRLARRNKGLWRPAVYRRVN